VERVEQGLQVNVNSYSGCGGRVGLWCSVFGGWVGLSLGGSCGGFVVGGEVEEVVELYRLNREVKDGTA
jgi:hypothetical protein